jgi:hypothetical protein
MSDHNCQFQVSLYARDALLIALTWTDDKDAVIEAMDEINVRGCRDLYSTVVEHDYRRGQLVIVKNGHVLLRGEPFYYKDVPHSVGEVCDCINNGNRFLRAAVITKGSGGVVLPDAVQIGG